MNAAVDRRNFLAAGAGLAASLATTGCAGTPTPAPPGKPEPQPIPPEKVPASEQIGLGMIGMGIRGRNLLQRYFLKNPRVRIRAVADVDRTRREHFRDAIDKHYGGKDCRAYTDYRDLLARDDIDAVVIATPDHWHVTQCIHAAEAGKDIYCEKPLSHTLGEGQRLIETIAKTGRVFQTGSQQRTEFGQKFVRAVESIRNGRLGDLLAVHVGVGGPPKPCDLAAEKPEPGLDWDRWLGPAPMRPYSSVLSPRGVIHRYPQWRRYKEYSNGHLGDMGAHHFDIVQWALNEDDGGPVEVLPPTTDIPGRGIRLRYKSGLVVSHGGPGGATFLGTKGMITVGRGHLRSFPEQILKQPIREDEFTIPRKTSHGDDWLECIQSRRTPTCSAEIGVRSAAVCQLANLGYQHGEAFSWDPVGWRFADPDHQAWMDYERRAQYRV